MISTGLAVAAFCIFVSVACGVEIDQPTQIVSNTATATPVPTAIPATPEPTATPEPIASPGDLDVIMVEIGNAMFVAEVADEAEKRARGLSGRLNLPEGRSMLFVFESGVASSFWMKGMEFPLDFIWISDDCRVVGFEEHVQPPAYGTTDAELERYASDTGAAFSLEVNAGVVERLGLQPSMRVSFSGSRSNLSYGCEEN